jgi:hypothetical protein
VPLYFVSHVESRSKFKLVLNSNKLAISKRFENEKEVSLFQICVGPKQCELAQPGLADLHPERPIYHPTPDRAPLLPDSCVTMLELIEHRPPHRSDPVSPQAGVAPCVVGPGVVTVKLDFTPGARV